MSSITLRPTLRLPTQRVSTPRTGRTHLSVHAVTNWILEPKSKGKSIDLTSSIADKSTAFVKSSGGDFTMEGLESTGLNLKFRSEGAGQKDDSPSDLYITDEGSDVQIKLDNEAVQKGKEYQLAIGMKIAFGDDAEYQVLRDARAHA